MSGRLDIEHPPPCQRASPCFNRHTRHDFGASPRNLPRCHRHRRRAVIVMHNHPSGESTPSEADIKVTRDLIRAGQLLKFELLDHVVIGNPGHFSSLRESWLFPPIKMTMKRNRRRLPIPQHEFGFNL